VVFGVSLDSLRQTRLYAERHRLTFPVLLFPESKLAFIYRTQRVPATMVLDSAGRVLYSRVGLFEGRSARDSVLSVLAGQAGSRVGAAGR
jgi:peroxiredoxin